MRGESVSKGMLNGLGCRWWPLLWLLCLNVVAGCMSARSEKATSAAQAPRGATLMASAGADEDMSVSSEEEASLGEDGGGMAVGGNAMGAPAPAPPPADEPAPAPETAPDAAMGVQPVASGPLLIYHATLHMAVFETRKVMDAIEKLAKDSAGYLVMRNDRTITVRVPAARFDGLLDEVGKQGDELHREVRVSDVTEQFNDLSIRLKNAEALRERLAQLLDKAQNVKEALAVEQQLERVAERIELIKGKLKRLRELIAFSTITVHFQARAVDKVESKVELPFDWLKQLGLPELLAL